MSPPSVRVNTFVKENEKPYIDPISKIFIISEVMFGLDRLPLIGRGKFIYVFSTFIIFIITNVTIVFMTMRAYILLEPHYIFMKSIQMSQNIISTLLSFTRCKWMLRYYSELSKFDAEAGCRPKVLISSIWNVIMATLSCIFVVMMFFVLTEIGIMTQSSRYLVPIHIIYVLEVYYFGHLLNLLTPRLKLVNYHIESSLSSAKLEQSPIMKEFVYFKSYDPKIAQRSMRKLMDLYQIVVEAYDCLNEGIKWQLLVIIITAFISILGFLYFFSLETIHSGGVLKSSSMVQLGIPVVLMTPLFSPCISGDSVHGEVKKMKELLASRLYENKLDKSGRSVARALLALTETRDLSFRLLRMLNIDISLPFKFVGLLVTYLIILLQFEKVINP